MKEETKSEAPQQEAVEEAHPNMQEALFKAQTSALKSAQMNNTLLVILLVAVSFFSGYLFFKNQSLEKQVVAGGTVAGAEQAQQPPAAPQVTQDTVNSVFASGNLVFGNKNAKAKLVMFTDPSCPFCHIAAGKNSQLNSEASGGRFKLVSDGGTYEAPLDGMRKLVEEGKATLVLAYQNGHGNGLKAAEAMYCAYEKGPDTFWKVHDLLMNGTGYTLINETVKNDNTNVAALAQFLAPAIDSAFLTECVTSNKYAQKVQADATIASSKFGVNGTPGFFVNTTNFAGAYNYTDMKSAIDQALN